MEKNFKKTYIFCKKNFRFRGNIIFEAGETYYYYKDDDYNDPDIFVYYNEKSTDVNRKGYRFYFEFDEDQKIDNINSLVYDYFYNTVEERKIKLQRINENR